MSKRRFRTLSAALLCLVLGVMGLGQGTPEVQGWFEPSGDNLYTYYPYSGYSLYYIGYNNSGQLLINGGGKYAVSHAAVAYNSGSTGLVVVSDPGSEWNMSSQFEVGFNGNGTLNVHSGGEVNNGGGILGYLIGSSGAATISGVGSQWNNNGELYVGYYGTGSLTVTDGGLVTAKTLLASLNDLHGDGIINVNGVALDVDLVFDANHSTSKTFNFGAGGQLNLNLDGTGGLGAGYKGSSSLRIADGVHIASTYGYIGWSSGSNGMATVTGVNTQWNNSLGIDIGKHGTGSLTVEEGAVVSCSSASVGAFGTGITIVRGRGSQWISSNGVLRLGWYSSGTGTLLVQDGGVVSSSSGVLGDNSGSNGMATISGQGSQWNNSYELYVGRDGTGTLTVEDGGVVSSKDGFIGGVYYGGTGTGTGTVTISGQGSQWNNSGDLTVGYEGTGTLTIEDGGIINNVRDAYLGYWYGGIGTATVSGQGSQWNSGSLYIGAHGTGGLVVEDGAVVSSQRGYLGSYSGGTGTTTVSGTGSQWNNIALFVGGDYMDEGIGTLTVANGGQVTAQTLSVNNKSKIRLHVSGNDMVVVGNNSNVGSITHEGKMQFYSDAFLQSGAYTPVSEFDGRNMSWTGSGTYETWGGMWDTALHELAVNQQQQYVIGQTDQVSSNDRLIFTNDQNNDRMGASFSQVNPGTSFSANTMDEEAIAELAGMLAADMKVRTAWDLTSNFTGGETMLSFEVGTEIDQLQLWQYEGGLWAVILPDLFIYDSRGIVSFITTSVKDYAITGYFSTAVVPVPAAVWAGGVTLLGLAGVRSLRRSGQTM